MAEQFFQNQFIYLLSGLVVLFDVVDLFFAQVLSDVISEDLQRSDTNFSRLRLNFFDQLRKQEREDFPGLRHQDFVVLGHGLGCLEDCSPELVQEGRLHIFAVVNHFTESCDELGLAQLRLERA